MTMVVLGTAEGSAAAETLLRRAGATTPADPGPRPKQPQGSAEGRGHDATTAATSANDSSGHPGAAPVPGELPEDKSSAAPAQAVVPPQTTKLPATEAKPAEKPVALPGSKVDPAKSFDPAKSKELPEKRTAQQRTFQNADGTFTTRSYPEPVNFRRADGSWAAIDTTLIPAGTATAGRAAPVQTGWTTTSTEQQFTLGLTADADPLVQLQLADGIFVGYSLQGAAPVQGTAQGSTITYAEARPKADLTILAGNSSFKENLVLKDATAPTEWVFPLRLQGVTASLDADGSVHFTDAAGVLRGRMPAGWMQDSAFAPHTEEGVISGGVSYELVQLPAGGQALKMKLDEAWLHAPERVYPVKVDPSLSSVRALETTYAYSGYEQDFSGDTVLKVGTNNGGKNQATSFIKFTGIEDSLSNATILGARLSLYNGWSYSCTPRTVTIHQVTSWWSPGSVRASSAPATGPALAAPSFAHGWRPSASSAWACPEAWESIDLGADGRNLVNSWTHHWTANYGLAIKSDVWDNYSWKQFGSANMSGGQPSLDVTWSRYGADYELWGLQQPVTATQEGIVRLRVWNRGMDTWTPTNNYKMSYLLYDQWNNNITDYGSNIAWTSMPYDVPPGGSAVVDAHIRALPQGAYTVSFTMDQYQVSNFWVDAYVPPISIQISSINIPPHITRLAPPSGAVVYQLQPTLTAEGVDPDRAPYPDLDYKFQVCRVVGGDAHVDCKQTDYLKRQSRFVIPPGWLTWNEQYAWYAKAGDGAGSSDWTAASYIRTVLPQPNQYTTAADSGRSVNTAAGNYTTAATDAALPVVGPALSVTRSYNSLDPRTDGAFGAGWSTAWDMRIQVETSSWLSLPGNVLVTAANGSRARFGWDPGKNTYVPGSGMAADLRKVDSGGWTLTDRSGTIHTFGADGHLTRITDTAGHTQDLVYASGHLAQVKDSASGRYLNLGWTGNHVTTVTAAGSTGSWSYQYNGDQLTKVCPPGADPAAATGCTAYEYGAGSRYRTAVRDAGPAGYWRLGQADGTAVANDAQVSDRSPADAKDVTWGASGALTASGNQAVTFNGRSTSYVELPNRAISSSANRSVELWFRTSSAGVILTLQNRAMGENPYNVVPALYVGSDGKLRGLFYGVTGGPITTPGTVTDNTWHHVVLAGARNTTALFLDGSLVGTAAGDIDYLNMDRAYLGGGYTGTLPGGNGGWSWFNGQIDEAAVYDYPLTEQTVAEHYALRTGSVQLTKTTLPSGRTSAQVAYDATTERVTKVTDAAGSDWKISEPTFSGGSFLYTNAVKASDPAGYWRLGERDGATAASEVGTGLSGTYGDGVTKKAPGVFAPTDDTAARLDGSAKAQIEIPQDVLHAKTDVAVELWFNTTTPGVLIGDQSRTIDDPNGVGGSWTPVMYVGSDGKLRGRFYGTATDSAASANPVTDGTWHHAVLSVQATAQTLYLDGQVVGVQTGTVDYQQNSHTYIGAGFARFWPAAPGDISHFTGSIDEVTLYQHPLSAGDVVAHYRARSAQVAGQGVGYRGSVVADSPAGFWRLDESAGTTAASEVAAIKGNGTYAPAVKPGTTGVFGPGDGRAAEFNGTASSYIDLPTPILQTRTELAAELWFRTAGPGVLLSTQSEPMGANPYNTVPVLYVGSDGKLRGWFYGITGGSITSAGAVTDGSWHHAAISAAQGTQSLYLDGTLVGTASGTPNHLNMNRTYLGGGYVGNAPGGNGGWSWLTGQIDEVAFYQHPLAADRIAAHYQARSASSATELASRVTLTDPAGNTTTDIHDVTRGNRLISRTDEAGNTTSYTYDIGGFVHTVTDPNGHSTVSGQDARGNTVSLTTCRDVNSCWTSYTSYYYNAANPNDPRNDKPSETRDARSAGPGDNTYRTTVAYNALGLPESTTRPDGRTTHTSYTTGTEPAADGGTTPPGLLASETTAGGAVTSYTYYASGDPARTTLPSGMTLTYGYNTAGRKTWATETSDAQPAGVTTTYEYDELGHLVAQTGPKVTDAVFGTEHQTKTTVAFDADGRPTSTTTADILGTDGSRAATTTYDSAGRPDSDTDPVGNTTRYGYDALSRRASVTDALGQVTRYTYTPRSQPATSVIEGWNGDGKGTRDLTTESRAYDPAGRLASVTDPMGAVTSYTYFDDGLPATTKAEAVTQADGSTRSIVLEANEYDGAGYLIKQTTGGGRTTAVHTVDPSGRVTQTVLDPGGLARTTTLGYDADDRVTATTLKVSDTENSVQTNTYDPAGRLTRAQLGSTTGGPTAVSTFTYDQRGLLTSSTTPNGNATGADPAAYTTTYQYDTLGRRTSTVAPQVAAESGGAAATSIRPAVTTGYNAFGEVVEEQDPLGNTTSRWVDALGRTTQVSLPTYYRPGSTFPFGSITKFEYDKLSRVTASTDGLSRKTTFTYDRLGHQIQRVDPNTKGGFGTQTPVYDTPPTWNATWTPTGLQLSATNPVGARTEATYDQLGRTLTATIVERQPTPQNLTTKFTWDDAGNRTALTTPAGNTSTATYNPAGQVLTSTDPLGRTSKAEYDGLGRTVRATAPLGESVRTHYDTLGNPAATDNLDPSGTVLRTATATFDLEGRVLSSTSPATGAVTSTAYDALGRVVKLTEPVAAGQAITTTFGYDAGGNRTRLTDGKGNTTVYTFNTWGLPESTIEPATTAHPAAADRTWTTTYDMGGQAVKLSEPGGITRTRTFDPAGRLVHESGTGAEAGTSDRDLAYDPAGHLIRNNSSALNAQNYTYNDRGLLISAGTDLTTATQTWEYDADGRVTKRWDKDTDLTTLGYKADGQLDWANNPKLKTQNWYGYDGDGRLNSQRYVAADPADATKLKAMSEQRLSYDGLGRLSGDQLLSGANLNTPLTGTAYEYDLDNRLTRKTVSGSATDPVKDNRYGYDQAGRLTSWSIDGTTTAYEWDAAGNRTRNGTATATYDERNRLLTDGTSTYRYTARGTLAAVTTAAKEDALAYDAFGRLITEGTTTYTYDGLDRVTTRNAARFSYDGGSNNPTSDGTWTYARDTAGNLLGAANATTSVRVRTDQHTDATATLDTNGTTVTGTTTYDPFGKPTATSGTSTSLGYQSGWTDPDTGDVNMHARWYRPGTGGFTSRDSYLLNPSPSAQANRYTYANANPLGGTDPSGHMDVSGCGCASGPAIVAGPGGSSQVSMGNAGGGIEFGDGLFEGRITIKVKPGSGGNSAARPAAPAQQAEPEVGEGSGYSAPSRPYNPYTPGFSYAGAPATGFSSYRYGSVPGNYAGNDIYEEKREAREHWRSSSPTSSPQSPTGTPAEDPEDTPDRDYDPQPSRPTCNTCHRPTTHPRPPTPRAEPPKPLWDKTRAAVERPAPQLDWAPRDPHDTLNAIAASYSSANLLAMVALTPNVLPSTVAAPGPQPGQSTEPEEEGGPTCLNRRPIDAEDNGPDGWTYYSQVKRGGQALGATACMYGETSGGTRADPNSPGMDEAKRRAKLLYPGQDTKNLVNSCHLIPDALGGRGVQANLSPCWTTPVNVGKMTKIQTMVKNQLKENIVQMSVVPDYMYQGSMIPFRYRFKIHVWNSKGVLIDYEEPEVYNAKDGYNLETDF
ncbi:DNRLRE domain-containing protein [Streptomyces kaniharaensis]|uniref:DNRLRE domain-containing protein n=1 Tax=Streptomyces kaniharaensis TaxID=212423 RepID=A0A6N7L2C0_9ACTN|nr:LamG-like jellyroll fold domain-containing protein [Streptomyces kaniharaensis]MQS15923.1 DNRLRE domain-containing protein [Streptomyces kaniharaensis]